VPEHPDADIIITMAAFEEQLVSRLRDAYQTEIYGLRPEVLMLVYIRRPLWDAFIRTRTGPTEEGQPR